MKHKFPLYITSLALVFSCGLISQEKNVSSTEAASHPANYDNYTYSGSYYNSIGSNLTEGMSGTLRTNLTSLIHPTSVPAYSGTGSQNQLSYVLQYADEDPLNSSNMIYLYTRDSVTKNAASSWNREHVWPQSLSNDCWGQGRAGADMLHLRPTYNTTNSTRGNDKYGEFSGGTTRIYNNITYGYSSGGYFKPLDSVKGDVARICMYVWVAYYTEYGNKLPALTNVFESFDTLMSWHTSDRPDVMEGNRNNYCENSFQGNRNPFVDHPEYAWKIFGSQCSTSVLNAAKVAYPEGSQTGITSISKTSATISIDETTTISATSSNSGTISWSSSNTSVATVSANSAASGSSITVTGVSEGTATITASITISGQQYSKTCLVTVSSSGSGGGEESGGHSGSSVALDIDFTEYKTSDTDSKGNTWTATGSLGTGNSYIQLKNNSTYIYNNPALLVDTSQQMTVSATLRQYGGANSQSLRITAYNDSEVAISNTVVLTPTSNSLVTYSGKLTFTSSNYHRVNIKALNGNNYTIGLGEMHFSYTDWIEDEKTLNSISVSTAPTKTTYTAGEYFNPTGLVITRNYTDSTSDTYTYSGHTSEFSFNPTTSTALTTSHNSVTITYGGKTTSQPITVNASAKTLNSISIQTAPTKISYTAGEYFDPTGLVITRNYSDATSDTYTYSGHTTEFSFSPSLSTALSTSHTSVTLSYSGKSTSQPISVTSGGVDPVSGDSETIVMSEQGYSDSSTVSTATGDNCTITFSQNTGSNPPKYYNSGSSVRLYAQNTMNVYSPDSNIIQITITYGSSDGSNSISVNTGTFESPVWEGSAQSVTFTIGGSKGNRRIASIEVVYESSGEPETPTSITASVSKTYYVGETISSSDITVKDNNNKTVSSFTFADDGYQFTYADAASAGALTNKTFANSISGANLTCSLTVQVQRKAYAAPTPGSTTYSTFTDLATSYTEGQSITISGMTFSVDGYKYSGKLSLSESKTSAPGKIVNSSPYSSGITNVTVSGATPDVQLSTDGSTWVDLSSATTSSVNYYYFKLFYKTTTQSNYVNITSFTVSYKGAESAVNVANYVMYEDTNNQCTTKFDVAEGYFKALTTSERSTFMTSSDYVLATARERLLAWAAHEGKTIQQSNGDYVVTTPTNILVQSIAETSGSVLIIVVVGLVAISAVGGYFFIKKRKEI